MSELELTKINAEAQQIRQLLDDYIGGRVEAAFMAIRDVLGQVRYISVGTMPAVLPYHSPHQTGTVDKRRAAP